MKAISIKQPWASLIIWGVKPIENRTWKPWHTGETLIHASGKWDERSISNLFTTNQWINIPAKYKDLIENKDLPVSAILGTVQIVGFMQNSPLIWAEKKPGVNHWILKNPVEYTEPIRDVKGSLRFWEYTGELPNARIK